jgi:hypothetical protein
MKFISEVTVGNETFVLLDELFHDEELKRKARRYCQARKLIVYEKNTTIVSSPIPDDELKEHGLPEADENFTWVRADDKFCPVENHPEYVKAPDGMIRKIEVDFTPAPLGEIDFKVHFARLSDAVRLGLLSEPAPPQIESVKSYADYLSDGSGMIDVTSMFPININVINRQLERWNRDFKGCIPI